MNMPLAPKVLVLLATYNGEAWLTEQIQSILAQEDVVVCILVGDDLSSDRTRDLIRQFSDQGSPVSRCGWDEGSGSAGSNFKRLFLCADLADFDFVALADQDDIWSPRKLISAIEAMNENGADGYSCSVLAFWPDGREAHIVQNGCVRSADFLFEGAGQGCTFVVRTSFFGRIQDFCRAHPVEAGNLHYHDWLIYLLCRAWGLRWHFDSRSWMRYRQHGGNEIGARGGVGAAIRRIQKIRSGWYSGQIQAASQLYLHAGGNDQHVQSLAKKFLERKRSGGVFSRASFAVRLVCVGRRRLSDRCILALAALTGWI
jgi:rhamnosyltransferase